MIPSFRRAREQRWAIGLSSGRVDIVRSSPSKGFTPGLNPAIHNCGFFRFGPTQVTQIDSSRVELFAKYPHLYSQIFMPSCHSGFLVLRVQKSEAGTAAKLVPFQCTPADAEKRAEARNDPMGTHGERLAECFDGEWVRCRF